MKFLVLGCNGMAGHVISLYLKEKGHDVIGFDRRKPMYVDGFSGDAQNTNELLELIRQYHFDTVINCIGILNQSAEDNKALAVFLNSYLPHFLAYATDGMDTQIIHMSTDCVFSGIKGDYVESDLKDGKTFYDRSKALGELDDSKNLTLRNSIVGPDINPNGIGLLNWFMHQNGQIDGFTKSLWTGQTTLQLAKTMEIAAKEKATGLYNMVPSYAISKFELLKLFNRYLRNNEIIVNPVDGIVADKSLKRTNFAFDYVVPDYEEMIYELSQWMEKHKDMYSHYYM